MNTSKPSKARPAAKDNRSTNEALLVDEHEGAALLGVSYWTTRELVNSGLLPSVAIPSPLNTRRRLRGRLIDRRDIEAFIAKYKTTERAR
jgi:hypothetical protein